MGLGPNPGNLSSSFRPGPKSSQSKTLNKPLLNLHSPFLPLSLQLRFRQRKKKKGKARETMRPLDETETTKVFSKLFKFAGNNLKNIVETPSHEGPDQTPTRYCFRLNRNRVYYVSESLVKRATNIKRDNLISLGTQIGKFTKNGSFHLTIQAVNLLAANAKHKVWLKPTSEMSFLYGNNVLKGGLGRITEGIVEGDGVVVFSMSDLPLGFGIAAKSTQDCRKMDPNGIVVLHQADIGEYLRTEDDM